MTCLYAETWRCPAHHEQLILQEILEWHLRTAGSFVSMQVDQEQQPVQQQQLISLKEHVLEGKSAVQINAAAGAIASAQEPHAHASQDIDHGESGASSPAAAPQHLSVAMNSSAQADSMRAEQTSMHPGSEVITVRIAVSPKADTDAVSCSSSPDSMDSVQVLKPLTPAQSSEHSPGSSTEEQRAAIASSSAAAEAPRLSCEVCRISTTSLELLQQHLQGRRHLKVLAVQTPAADASARCEATCLPHNSQCAWHPYCVALRPQASTGM